MTVWSLHVLSMSVWVSSGCSGFFPQSKDVLVRWIGHAKLPLSVQIHLICTSLDTKGQFNMANPPNLHIFGLWEETGASGGKSLKFIY